MQEYKLFPSALITRAMFCVAVRASGGVEVSSAAAKTFLFGRPILDLESGICGKSVQELVYKIAQLEFKALVAREVQRKWLSSSPNPEILSVPQLRKMVLPRGGEG